jgi:uncharacterized sodium:solute symporter family permease YidK
MNTMRKAFAPARTDLIFQGCFFALLSILAGLNFYEQVFRPTETSIATSRTFMWTAVLFAPIGLLATILALRRIFLAALVAVGAQFALTCFLIWGVASLLLRLNDDLARESALEVFIPMMLFSSALSFSQIFSLCRSMRLT